MGVVTNIFNTTISLQICFNVFLSSGKVSDDGKYLVVYAEVSLNLELILQMRLKVD